MYKDFCLLRASYGKLKPNLSLELRDYKPCLFNMPYGNYKEFIDFIINKDLDFNRLKLLDTINNSTIFIIFDKNKNVEEIKELKGIFD